MMRINRYIVSTTLFPEDKGYITLTVDGGQIMAVFACITSINECDMSDLALDNDSRPQRQRSRFPADD